MRYHKQQDGEWVQPVRKGYRMACCDCGLIHRIDFRLIPHGSGRAIIFRAFRLATRRNGGLIDRKAAWKKLRR